MRQRRPDFVIAARCGRSRPLGPARPAGSAPTSVGTARLDGMSSTDEPDQSECPCAPKYRRERAHRAATGARFLGKVTRHSTKLATAALGAAAALPFIGVGAAVAAGGSTMATLRPVALNGGEGSGTAMVEVKGTRIDVTVAASGPLADSPHAAHPLWCRRAARVPRARQLPDGLRGRCGRV